MQDALLCYYMILNMRHAGCFLVAAEMFRRVIASLRLWRASAEAARCGFRLATNGGICPVCCARQDWARPLERLENYAAAMA